MNAMWANVDEHDKRVVEIYMQDMDHDAEYEIPDVVPNAYVDFNAGSYQGFDALMWLQNSEVRHVERNARSTLVHR